MNDVPTHVRGDREPGLRLLVLWQGGSATHELGTQGELVVGRGEDTDICIPHGSVSRRHARLRATERGWEIEDLGSSNGTFVGGRKLPSNTSAPLVANVVVAVGDARLVLDAAAPAATELSPPMQQATHLALLVADSTLPILILGETGVGKGRMAEEIHARSSRAGKSLLRLNCAAVPEALLESELFGHERGAFTGAVQAKQGLLEAASGGTVFLDEIGETPRPTQAKLLHVLEHNEVMRVGAVKPRPIDVRFIAATNRELESQVTSGQFRRDLYFRLAGVPITIPPLRERTSEIPAMAISFLEEACTRAKRAVPGISAEALERMMQYPWPGNIRELRNVMQRAALLCGGGAVRPEHLLLEGSPIAMNPALQPLPAPPAGLTLAPPPPPPATAPRSLEAEMREVERRRIIEALELCGGHQGKAAEHLGISRRTLTNKLNELRLPRPRKLP